VPQLLLTYEAAAVVLALSVRTLKRRIAAGDVTPVMVGGLPRIRRADLDAYVAALPSNGTERTHAQH
jgi:excisionase family DNA binding protein